MACNVTLSSIPQLCSVNLSGVKKIAIANYVEGAFTLDSTPEGNNVLVTIAETVKDWVLLEPASETGSYTTTLTRNDSTGVCYWTTEITGNYNVMNADRAKAVDAIGQGRLVLVCEDMNGTVHCCGLDEAVTPSAITGQTGAARDDGAFYTITLQTVSKHPDYICTAFPTIAAK